MKKILACIISFAFICLSFSGCENNNEPSSSMYESDIESSYETSYENMISSLSDENTVISEPEQSSSQTESPIEKYPPSAEKINVQNGATENMLKRSLLYEGDSSRLAEKLSKALENPKQITNICFLGDSITAGSGSSQSANAYVNRFKTWWEETISPYVDVKNAGIGATTSYLAVHRVEKQCFTDYTPDIIVIEFINDTDDEFYKASTDSLVRKCLEQPNNPAVILLEAAHNDGSSPHEAQLSAAQAYNVPMISYHDAVMPEINAGSMEWSEISGDNVHPNDAGHGIMAQLLTNYISGIKDNLDLLDKTSKPFDPNTPSPCGDIYKDAVINDKTDSSLLKVTDEGSFTEDIEYPNIGKGWATVSGGSITFEITAKNIGMAYGMRTDGKNALAAVKVDDNESVLINSNFASGWGNYIKTEQIFTSEKAETHTVTLTVIDDDTQTNFQLYSWLLS